MKKNMVTTSIYIEAGTHKQMLEIRERIGIPLAEMHRRALAAWLVSYMAANPLPPKPPTTSPREETITT